MVAYYNMVKNTVILLIYKTSALLAYTYQNIGLPVQSCKFYHLLLSNL